MDSTLQGLTSTFSDEAVNTSLENIRGMDAHHVHSVTVFGSEVFHTNVAEGFTRVALFVPRQAGLSFVGGTAETNVSFPGSTLNYKK